jgi:hypothetical protein
MTSWQRILIATCIAACGASPAVEAADRSPDKQFGEVRADQALVYLIREKRFAGSGRTMFLYADQAFLGTLDNDSYAFTYLSPGKHLLWTNWAKINVEAEFEAGKTYYYAVWSSFDPLDESSGTAYVQGVKSYVTPEPAEVAKSEEHIRDRYGKAVASAAEKPDDASQATNLSLRAEHIAKWPKLDLAGYPVLCLEPFVMADPKAADRSKEYQVESAPQRLAKLVVDNIGADTFAEVRQSGTCEAGTGVAVLRAQITQYKPGSETARMLLIGAGSAQIELIVTLTDAQSGASLVSFEPKGLWAWGGAVGVARGIADLEKNVAFEISSYLKQSRGIALPEL